MVTGAFFPIYQSGMCNIQGISKDWVKPNPAKGRYLEIGFGDLAHGSTPTAKMSLPELKIKIVRQSFLGNAFVVQVHPKLPGGGMHLVEAIDGDSPFLGLAIADGIKPELAKDLSYIARIYEVNNGGN